MSKTVIALTVPQIETMLKQHGFREQPAMKAAFTVVHHVHTLLEMKNPTETFEGIGTEEDLRDALVVDIADETETDDPNLLDFERADQTLTLIENMIANLCEKQNTCVHIGNMEFEFIERVEHTLTNAESSWLAKMEEEETFVNDEDEKQSKQLLAEVKAELASIPPRPRFRIIKLD